MNIFRQPRITTIGWALVVLLGLGLNITKAIVEGHGGNIGFENLPGKGTMFYIDLPQGRDILVGKPSPDVEDEA